MGEHPVEQDIATGSLIDVGTAAMVIAYFLLALAPAVEVEVYTDSPHAGQGAEALLLVLAVSVGPMAVRTYDEGVLALLQRGIDGAEQVLSGCQFNADVLRGIAVVLTNLRQGDRPLEIAFLVLCHDARVEELIQLQPLAYLTAQRVATGLPLGLVAVEARQVVEHHLTLLLVPARILVELDFIEVATLLPPVPVKELTDVVERHLQRVRTHTEISIGQTLAYRIDIAVELELYTKSFGYVVHQVMYGTLVACLKCLRHRRHRRCCQQDSDYQFSHFQ